MATKHKSIYDLIDSHATENCEKFGCGGDAGPRLAKPAGSGDRRPDSHAGPPPVGNTGGNLTNTGLDLTSGLSLKLDWLNAVAMSGQLSVDALDAIATRYLGAGDDLAFGRHTYTRSRRYQHGAALMWTPGRADVMLSLNGDVMAVVGPARWRELLAALAGAGAHCTRLDVAADDADRSVPLAVVRQARDDSNVIGPRVSRVIEGYKRHGAQQVSTGCTIEFGKRGKDGSGRFLRVYDKELESGGEQPGIRWEVEFSKDFAQVAFKHLLDADDDAELARMMGRLLAGSIDFRDRDGGRIQHVDRMPRLDWWQTLVSRLGAGLVLRVARVIPPLQRTVLQCWKQYAKSLAVARVICDSMAVDFAGLLGRLLDDAHDRIDWRRTLGRNLSLDLRVVFGDGPPRPARLEQPDPTPWIPARVSPAVAAICR